MKNIIKLTVLVDLASCLVMFFSTLITKPNHAFGALFFSFGNLLVPTFIGVLIFRFVRKWLIVSNPFRTVLFQTVILTFIFLIGIFIWAVADVLLYGNLHQDNWNITKEFNSEFKFWLPALFSLAFFIPFIDNRISRIDMHKGNN